MTEPMHIVLDETAMAAAGTGNVLASRLIHRAHAGVKFAPDGTTVSEHWSLKVSGA